MIQRLYFYYLMRKQFHKQKQTIAIRTLNEQLNISNPINHQNPEQYTQHNYQVEQYLNSFSKDHVKRQSEPKLRKNTLEDHRFIDSPTKLLNSYLKSKEITRQESPNYLKQTNKSQNSSKMGSKVFDLSLNISKINKRQENEHVLRCIKERMQGVTDQERDIIDSIKFLKQIENNYVSYFNQDSKLCYKDQDDNCEDFNPKQEGQNDINKLKQIRTDMEIKFKEKIKCKQSRKHIYHVLKCKSEARQKIRAKTFNHFDHKLRLNQMSIAGEIQTSKQSNSQLREKTFTRMNCGELNLKLKTTCNYKNTKPLLQNIKRNYNDLKIESKPYFQTSSNFAKKNTDNYQFNNILNDKNCKRSGIEIYKEIIANIIPKQKKMYKKYSNNFNQTVKEKCNEFKFLTPWGEYED